MNFVLLWMMPYSFLMQCICTSEELRQKHSSSNKGGTNIVIPFLVSFGKFHIHNIYKNMKNERDNSAGNYIIGISVRQLMQ